MGTVETDPLSLDDRTVGGLRLGGLLKCIYGCKITEKDEVIPLTCLHLICSDACAKRLKAETEPGSVMRCKECKSCLTSEIPSLKLIPEKRFKKKNVVNEVALVCEHCVLNEPAVAFCPECPACLCDQCTKIHPQLRATMHHKVVKDLSEQKAKQLEKIKESEMKCKDHDLTYTFYCAKCSKKICQKCDTQHQGHEKYNLESEDRAFELSIEMAGYLTEKFERATHDIRRKCTEMQTTEWENISASINQHFQVLTTSLARRRHEAIKEAKERFMKQVMALNMRSTCAALAKNTTQRFVEMTNDVKEELDKVSRINFKREFRGYFEWLTEMDKKMSQDYKLFVDQDWHFKVDSSSTAEFNRLLSECCQLEYSYMPKGLSEDVSSKKTLDGGGKPSRRIAVKSTAAAQGSSSRRSLSSFSKPTASTSNGNALLKIRGTKNHSGIADAETETEEDEDLVGKNKANQKKGAMGKNKTRNDDDVENDDDVHSAVTVCLRNGDETMDVSDADGSLNNSRIVKPPQKSPSTRHRRTGTSSEGISPDAAENDDNSKDRPGTVSPASSSESSSDLGVGKRERKKKSFPGYVDSDESLKFMKTPTQMALVRSKRRSNTTKPSLPKIARLSQVKQEACENSLEPIEDENNFVVNVESENGIGYESSDGNASDTTRRHSQRKKGLHASPARKSRGSKMALGSEIDSFPEAPFTSIEIPPEFCDYPILGQGRMKITNTDNNEDYCAVCMDGGEEIIVCCDYCPKVFHLNCHIPTIKYLPEGEEKWRCNYDTTKKQIEDEIAAYKNIEGSENSQLVESNERHFKYACKFVMECYKIPEIPTMRWVFPDGYKELFGKVPYHLKYIRERLCLSNPEPFASVKDMLLAFRQMFIQAFAYYSKKKPKLKATAVASWTTFLNLVDEYYPKYKDIFKDVNCNM